MDEQLFNRNRNIHRGFRGLEIWKKAIEIYKLVYNLLKDDHRVPFKIKAQIEDSVLSISSNIAEGYSRRTIKENLRFYEIALSSAAENYLPCEILRFLGYCLCKLYCVLLIIDYFFNYYFTG